MATRKKKRTATLCLCPGCNNKAQSRGLCWSDLATAKAAIRAREITEQELIDSGLMLPVKRMGRPHKTAMSKALAKKRK